MLEVEHPDGVIVYGDTNSTLTGALAASKLNIPVAHVEAGLRSYDRAMPEEQNRVVTDHLSSVLFCPIRTAAENLRKEGITEGSWIVGDVMYDASLFYRDLIERCEVTSNLGNDPADEFYILTLHRAENTDDSKRLTSIVAALNSLNEFPVVFPIHPHTRKAISRYGLTFDSHVQVIEPVGYFEMFELEKNCRFVVTDYGGVQKEAFPFTKPCISLRDRTEWVETLNSGCNVLVGADEKMIRAAFLNIRIPTERSGYNGDGSASRKMLEILASQLS